MEKRLLSVNQAAKLYNVSRPAVKDWLEMGLKHNVQPNGYYEIDREDLRKFLVENQIIKLGKVLIVDDDAQFAKLMGMTLDQNGYETMLAHNIVDALMKVKSFDPDLIVLDIIFPEKDGWELAKSIKKDIPILFISGEIKGQDVVDKCLELNGVGFMEKPFDPEELEKEVSQAMKHLKSL